MRLMVLLMLFVVSSANNVMGFDGIRLVWTTNPQTEALISWDSLEVTTDDYVMISAEGKQAKRFDSSAVKAYSSGDKIKSIVKKMKKIQKKNKGAGKSNTVEIKDVVYDEWKTDAKGIVILPILQGKLFYRHVRLTGLKPSTKYTVTAHSNGKKSREYYFITAPDDDRAFKLLYVGDSRTRLDATEAVSLKIADMVEKDPKIIAVIHGGDFADNPTVTCWKPWLEMWTKTTGKDGRLIPLIPVVGNHELPNESKIFSEAYDQPGGNDNFNYSCDLSPNFRIAILNSEITSEGAQREFIEKTLTTYKQDKVTWQIVAFHRPVYPAVKKPSNLKRLIPVFDEYDIDLVFESDGHCIKRTVPIKNGKKDLGGTVYLGEGGYGAPQRKTKKLWYLEEPGFASAADHIMVFDVSPKLIDYQTIGKDGAIIDKFSFKAKVR